MRLSDLRLKFSASFKSELNNLPQGSEAAVWFRKFAALVVLYAVIFQTLFFAVPRVNAATVRGSSDALQTTEQGYVAAIGDRLAAFFSSETDASEEASPESASLPLPTPTPTPSVEAAISRRYPTLNGGTITGSLRVLTGEAFNINSGFQMTGDLYTVGTPNVIVNAGASHGGIVDDGGTATPSGYNIIFNSGAAIPGKIHTRANATPLPADIPTSVPSPSGTRTVNINTAADLNNIGSWSTLRSLNVNPSNVTINVPPGNYNTISLNGTNIKLVFSAGTYNFSGTLNLNGGGSVQANGATTINIGQSLNINNGSFQTGATTAASDVKLNIVGTTLSLNSGSSIKALVRAANANVNINNGTIRGQVIANFLAINSGQIIGEASSSADTTPPTVQITSPANNSTTTTATIAMSGGSSDNVGVTSVKINGVSATLDAATGAWSAPSVALAVGANQLVVQAFDAAGNVGSAQITVTRIVNNSPTVNAGADQAIELPNGATLAGTASDDGYPSGTLTTTWTKVSGAGAVVFADAGARQTSATFAAAGNYVLRLTASDGVLSSFDDVAITVYPQNQAPTVNAGNDQTIQLPNAAALAGQVADDGYPVGDSLSVLWTKVSGDGVVTFANPTASATSATFSAAGTYVLRLTASDGRASTADDIVVAVLPANQAPVVSAGADQSIELPSTATLAGTATDDGYPTPATLTYQWQKVSGPGQIVFGNPSELSTDASFTVPGIYQLRLTVSDGDLSTSDDLIVNVAPNRLAGASIILSPTESGPRVIGSDTSVTALLRDAVGQPLANRSIQFTVNGVNPRTGSVETDANGNATLTFAGLNSGIDTIRAKVSGDGLSIQSNEAHITWVALVQGIATTTVLGRFFSGSTSGGFDVPANAQPLFTQQFPTINFNPAPGTVNGNNAGVSPSSRPMTNVTTDYQGNFTGTIVTGGNGFRPGQNVHPSAATFSGTFLVGAPGEITFDFFSDDGFYFGIGNGATRVSGVASNLPVSGQTSYLQLPVMGGYNLGSAPTARSITVYFPAAGTYPYEVDWADCCLSEMAMTVTTRSTGRGIVPLGSLALSPNVSTGIKPLGRTQNLTVVARDSEGSPMVNQPVTFHITGANPFEYTTNTDVNGHVSTSYTPVSPGFDKVQVTTEIPGMTIFSNAWDQEWRANQSPVAIAPGPQTTYVPVTQIPLFGTAFDDNLPNGSLAISWTKVSGPGNVIISNPGSPVTLASFDQTGVYVLRLTANDGELSVSSDVTITVNPAPTNGAPIVDAGPDQVATTENSNARSIFSMNADGSNVRRVSLNTSEDYVQGVSRIGSRILFISNRDGNNEVYSMTFDGTDQRRLTFDPSNDLLASWSPDGSKILFTSDRGGNFDTWVMDSDGTNVRRLNNTPAAEFNAHWQPAGPGINGNRIAYFKFDGSNFNTGEIWTMNTDGTDQIQLTSAPGPDDTPVWSPDGTKIALTSFRDGQREIYIMNADGSSQTRLTFDPVENWVNDWAPDGQTLIEINNKTGDYEVYSRRIADGTSQRLTFFPDEDTPAFASPDGTKIVFSAHRRGVLLRGSATDDGWPFQSQLTTSWSTFSGPAAALFSSVFQPVSLATFSQPGNYTLKLSASDTQFVSHDTVDVNVVAPVNAAPVVFAGADRRVPVNSPLSLRGIVGDDALPSGNSVTQTWSKVSGPGSVTFSTAVRPNTDVNFSAVGVYTLQLSATDGLLTATDEIVVTVDPPNAAPTVNAGPDQNGFRTIPVQLSATATDDGQPFDSSLTYQWSKVSGLGTVNFSNASALSTNAVFATNGSYVLRLTVSDGDLEAFDDVAVTITEAVNQPPVVSAGAGQTISLPTNSANLNGSVTDDQLLNGQPTIAWSKTSGPGNVTFDAASSAQTTATFDAVGTYVLRLTANDGQFLVWSETVVTLTEQNLPPTVNAGVDQTTTVTQPAILEAVQVSDDGLPVGGAFSAAWTKVSGPGSVTFSNPDQTATYATFSETGTYVVRLTVSDSLLSASDDVTVTVIEDQPAPTVEITSPDDGATATGPTAIAGTVSAGNWTLDYSYNDSDDLAARSWRTIASGSGAVSGQLGSIDTTLILNGLYDVRLTTVDQFGRSFSDIVSVSVEKNLKVGHFTVSFDDMSVPVAGIPIQVVRTYDSRDKRKGDFGYGWNLSLRNVTVQKSAILGLKWFQTRSNTFIPTYCVEPTKPHIVTVTMPDGQVEKFEAKLQTQCQQAAPLVGGNVVFIPQNGTRGRLEVIGSNEVAVAGSVPGPVDLIGFDGNGIFDRSRFKYISKEGTEFTVNQSGGLEAVRDTNGNTITITPGGITHSSGQSVVFTRDAQGRITAITDPAGNSNIYAYDANGDLASFTDRSGSATTFTYEPTIPHHLKSIVDPLGRTPIRNDYDADGRLLKHTDAAGNEIVYTHNLAARIETVTDRLGHPTVYEYDARGNVLVKRDALGHETTFAYDANDNVLSETDPLGRTVVHTYDPQDNRLSTTDPLGHRTEMTYNAKGQPLTVKDPRGNITTNTYDTAGNLLTTTDAQGNVTTNFYSIQTGQLTRTTDALGHVTTFDYVGSYLTKQTDAQGNETTFGYDANGNRSSQTVKRTNPTTGQLESITTTFEYDNQNRLKKSIQPDGTFTTTEFNELGQQVATVDQLGRRTEFAFDNLGRQVKTTYADAKFEESTFDLEGRRLTSKDRAGRVTHYLYDALGRLTKTTYPDATFTTTVYDAAGQVLSSTDARGNSSTFTYDDAGRRQSIKDALDHVTSFVYDSNGNQTSMVDALGHNTEQVYDSLNRRTRTNFADGTFTETTFDELGRRVAEKDQAGKVTQFGYDSLGRLTSVTDALGQQTRYEYNELGQQTKQIDAMNRATSYEYDRLGRRTKRILPLGQFETYSYKIDGSLASKTDFNGKTTTFAYDNMRRLVSKTPDASLNQPSISFTYNDLGQRASMTDASGTTVYGYDGRNRLQSKQTPFGTLTYGYDDGGNLQSLRSSHANGVSVDYGYDELNRLKTAKDNRLVGLQTTSYTYDAVGNLQSYTYPNQVTTSYAYNDLNRLTAMTVSNQLGGLQSYAYTLGPTGNRTKVVEGSGRTVDYAYDDLYRLTSETIANSQNNGQITYQFDAVGNRLQRTSTVNGVANQSPTYDANDRLNSDVYDNNGSTKVSNGKSYDYDFENRLTSVSYGITIVYDGDGNRVSKTANGITTNYLVDTNNLTGYAQVVEELQNNQVVKTYTYGLDLISQRSATGVNFYQYDGHGSVRGLTDTSANITDTYAYDAFGTITERTGTTSNNYLYAGEQFDADLGFYYNRARYLNAETGRLISKDTYEGNVSVPGSLHKYAYAFNNPVDFVDPSGHIPLPWPESAIVGQNVHRYIITDFIRGSFGTRVGDQSIASILSLRGINSFAAKLAFALRPDLAELGSDSVTLIRAIYEIKTIRQEGLGVSQLYGYLGILNAFDPGWGPGQAYLPPSNFVVSGILGLPYTVTTHSPFPGVISYDANPLLPKELAQVALTSSLASLTIAITAAFLLLGATRGRA